MVFELVVPWYIVTKLRLGLEVAPHTCVWYGKHYSMCPHILQTNHIMTGSKEKVNAVHPEREDTFLL